MPFWVKNSSLQAETDAGENGPKLPGRRDEKGFYKPPTNGQNNELGAARAPNMKWGGQPNRTETTKTD